MSGGGECECGREGVVLCDDYSLVDTLAARTLQQSRPQVRADVVTVYVCRVEPHVQVSPEHPLLILKHEAGVL